MKSVRVTIHLRDNSTKELIENISDGSGDTADLKTLVQSLTSLQSRVNSCLTELVEQERETTQTTTQNSTQSSTNSDDDDLDEEDDDDDENSEPPAKQQKR